MIGSKLFSLDNDCELFIENLSYKLTQIRFAKLKYQFLFLNTNVFKKFITTIKLQLKGESVCLAPS